MSIFILYSICATYCTLSEPQIEIGYVVCYFTFYVACPYTIFTPYYTILHPLGANTV